MGFDAIGHNMSNYVCNVVGNIAMVVLSQHTCDQTSLYKHSNHYIYLWSVNQCYQWNVPMQSIHADMGKQ